MEQKRTLWIILASGIFLLVVLMTVLILYAPSAGKNTSAALLADSGEIWTAPQNSSASRVIIPESKSDAVPETDSSVIESLASPLEGSTSLGGQEIVVRTEKADSTGTTSAAASASTLSADGLTIISNGPTNFYAGGETTIDLNALKNGAYEKTSNVTAANEVAERAMKETETAHRIEEQTTIERTVEKPSPKASTTVKKAPAAPQKTGTTQKTSSTQKSSATASTAKPSTAAPKVTSFWVQAASYESKKRADEAREILDSYKINCEVFTYKDSKGKLYYRVRAGSYTTKSEAEYWKKRIDSIPEFAKSGSYVTSTTQEQ